MKNYLKLLLFVYCLLNFGLAKSQNEQIKIKTAFIFRFAQNLEWQNENQIQEFTIAFLGNNQEVYNELVVIAGKKKLKDKVVKIISYKSINDLKLPYPQIIFLDSENNSDIENVFQEIYEKNILLITDGAKKQKFVMINFIYPNKKMSFEINKKTIIDQKINIDPKLLLLGGSEIDVRELYKKQEKELDEERKRVEEQQKSIENQKNEISKLNSEIELKQNALKKQEVELKIQQQKFDEQKGKLTLVQREVSSKQSQLSSKINELTIKEIEIKKQVSLINMQKEKVLEGKKILDEQNKEIELRKEEISKQQQLIGQKDVKISTQQDWLYIAAAVLFVILTLSFFLVRNILAVRRANKELEAKNIAIREKNFEISEQKDAIEHQSELIQSSIRYAKTIQLAILPERQEISNKFDNMIIYKPKDVISGDFYWHSTIAATENSNEINFIAAVDCTGHGVPGAFMSMIGNRLLNELVNEKGLLEPAQVLEELNLGVQKALRQDKTDNNDGMDVCLCRIENGKSGEKNVMFSGAKRHLYHFEKISNEIKMIKGDRKTIGKAIFDDEDSKFTNKNIVMKSGDLIVLTTDGFTDQNNPEREKFGNFRFEQILLQNANKNINEIQKALETALENHQKSSSQRDDITIIGIKC